MVLTRRQRKAANVAHSSAPSGDDEETPSFNIFKPFPRLPAEMRARIWMFRGSVISEFPPAILDPRLRPNVPLHSYFSQTQLPPALHVNRELRAETLKWYKLAFGREVLDRCFTITFPPKIYVNFEVNRLCWMGWGAHILDGFRSRDSRHRRRYQATELYQQCQSQNLRRLALNPGKETFFTMAEVKSLLPQIAFLEEIVIMFEPRYAGPWKNDIIELKDFRRRMEEGPPSEDISRFKKDWRKVCDESKLEHTPILKYMALLKKPSVEYALLSDSD
ncbi:hypothetical protein DL98DRAFT_600865 [Cadophora sp. DSE1049]|nr:hypothetical protein DL98DRAFT_600865 [Cadophora sp. DSE1049]